MAVSTPHWPQSLDEAKSDTRRNPMTSNARNLEELSLIRLICSGGREHFYTLVEPYQRMVYSTAYGVVGNEADAEDVAQEALLKALKGLHTFRAEAKFSTWLVQITLNEARMLLRRTRRRQYQSLDSAPEGEEGEFTPRDFADWREIPSEALATRELRTALVAAVSGLKQIYREVIVLRDMRQLTVRQSAELLGVSDDVVKTRLLRARLQLREALSPGYDGCWTSNTGEYRKVRPW